ncbi:CoA transferase [Streptomyces sp. NPDC044571]|uniref:CoA transferase n=1 Tax=Streptomyces sp. NPDC044571 TaxID=3155371 RepID=UPI0033C67A55
MLTPTPELALRTLEMRLGDRRGPGAAPSEPVAAGPGGQVETRLTWYGGAAVDPFRPGGEAAVQALSGLMHVHGQEAGAPRRLGLPAASVAAGILAGHGVLAARIARARGAAVHTVETSVLRAATLLAGHYVAEATAPDPWGPAVKGTGTPPPFRSADGPAFEVETFDPGAWRHFWQALGADAAALGRSWTAFQYRYVKGYCFLPDELHAVAARTPWSRITATAAEFGLSLAALRGYREVLAEPGRSEDRALLTPLTAADGGAARPPHPGGLPLAGLRVVEATSRVQGPLTGLLLSRLGAEVTWIEPPQGDPSGMGALFHQGKRRVGIDLGGPAGRAGLRELASTADVFLHNWRPGKAEEWGFGPADLARVNPRLVHAAASGWGSRADRDAVLGTEFMVQAYAGVTEGNTPAHRSPATTRVLLCDMFGALVTCEGVLQGLLRREREGRAWQVEASLLGGAMALQSELLLGLAAGDESGRRAGRPLWLPVDEPLPTADGHLVLGADDDAARRTVCDLLGVRAGARGQAAGQVRERLRDEPAEHWEKRLTDAGLPAAVVSDDLEALPADPRLAPLFTTLGDGTRVPASPWVFHS